MKFVMAVYLVTVTMFDLATAFYNLEYVLHFRVHNYI